MTKNNFSKLKKVVVGDFPDNNHMRYHYESHGMKEAWILYKKIADESKKDLDNLATCYQDYGIEVFRPKFDQFTVKKWSKIRFKPPFSMSDRFFAYGDLIFYLSKADDSQIIYSEFFRDCLEKMHDQGKHVFVNPPTLETEKMQHYDDKDWPGDQGFALDGPCFIPVEDRIFFNRKHCNTNRGIEWIQRTIQKFYPKTEFVDVSHKFVNHLDNQIRIFNEKLAISCGSLDYTTEELKKTYKDITVLDTSTYQEQWLKFRSAIFSGHDEAVKEAEWLKAWVDFDDQNGNVLTGSVSIDDKTVIGTYNNIDLYDKLETHGLKVEKVPLRHAVFWGASIECETAVLEREENK